MVALVMPYTDRFGVSHPSAWIEIVALHLEMTPDGIAGDYRVSCWHDQQTRAAGNPPFEERAAEPFRDDDILTLQAQFGPSVYGVLAAKQEFSGAQVIAS